MKADAESEWCKGVKIFLTTCEARCLLDYLTGARGKEQRAVYVEFCVRLRFLAERKEETENAAPAGRKP